MELKLISFQTKSHSTLPLIAPLLELKRATNLVEKGTDIPLIAPLLELKRFIINRYVRRYASFNCTAFGIETLQYSAHIHNAKAFNCTAFGIETMVFSQVIVYYLPLIAPLLELKLNQIDLNQTGFKFL